MALNWLLHTEFMPPEFKGKYRAKHQTKRTAAAINSSYGYFLAVGLYWKHP